MKLRKLFNYLCLPMLLVSLLLTACNVEPSNEEPSSDLSEKDSDRYVIQTPLYQIYEEGLQEYSYKIGTRYKVFAEGDKQGTEPQIDEIGSGIVRLFMSYGTNAFSVQYFDVWEDRTSREFNPYTIYADYADTKTKECLITYFDFSSPSGKNCLNIKDIFDEQGFSTEVDRGFISATCNQLIFLNESEIYLDYDVFADGYSNDDLIAGNPVEFKNIREVVKFR